MIKIGKPYVYEKDERAYLKASVKIPSETVERYKELSRNNKNCVWLTEVDYPPKAWDEKDTGMWFSVPSEFGQYLCRERSNAFVIALFWMAMITESDICFEAPISKKLHDGLVGGIMAEMRKKGRRSISLIGPLTEKPVQRKKGTISGMSCGVDSMYTLETHNLDYLTFYEVSYLFPQVAVEYDLSSVYESESRKTAPIVAFAKKIGERKEIPLIHVLSNLDRDYYRGGRIYNAMYRFLACTLILEPMYSKYISSSSGHGKSIETDLLVPSQHYEDLICRSCQTEGMTYENSDHESRIEKIRFLADNVDFMKYATVCYNERNCGECYGCWKTIFPLDIMGKLENFNESFDLGKYSRTRKKQFRDFINFTRRPEADSARELLQQLKELAESEQTEAAGIFLKVCEEETGIDR